MFEEIEGYFISRKNILTSTSSYTQTEPSPWPYTNLWGKKIRMSGLDVTHRQFAITPKDKYRGQLFMILSNQINKSTINYYNINTKTPKDNIFKYNVGQTITQRRNILI